MVLSIGDLAHEAVAVEMPGNKTSRWPTRRFWLILSVVILLVALMGFGWWLFILKPKKDDMRPFIGTWKLDSPFSPTRPELQVELDILSDGTLRDRIWNSRNGTIEYDAIRPNHWRVMDGKFQEFSGGDSFQDLIGAGSKPRIIAYILSWDGPDRLQLQSTSATQKITIWRRCEPHR